MIRRETGVWCHYNDIYIQATKMICPLRILKHSYTENPRLFTLITFPGIGGYTNTLTDETTVNLNAGTHMEIPVHEHVQKWPP